MPSIGLMIPEIAFDILRKPKNKLHDQTNGLCQMLIIITEARILESRLTLVLD